DLGDMNDNWNDWNGPSVIDAGPGNDNPIDGGEGDDVIHGGSGNDVLIGGRGNDTLDGGLGDDDFEGIPGEGLFGGNPPSQGAGQDYLEGGNGDDALTGGPDVDTFYGEDPSCASNSCTGRDQIFARDGNPEFVACGPGIDAAQVDGNDQVRNWVATDDQCESV